MSKYFSKKDLRRKQSEDWARKKSFEFYKANSELTFAEWCYQQGKADGIRGFAKWLKNNGKIYGVKSYSYIPDLISIFEKEQKNE